MRVRRVSKSKEGFGKDMRVCGRVKLVPYWKGCEGVKTMKESERKKKVESVKESEDEEIRDRRKVRVGRRG